MNFSGPAFAFLFFRYLLRSTPDVECSCLLVYCLGNIGPTAASCYRCRAAIICFSLNIGRDMVRDMTACPPVSFISRTQWVAHPFLDCSATVSFFSPGFRFFPHSTLSSMFALIPYFYAGPTRSPTSSNGLNILYSYCVSYRIQFRITIEIERFPGVTKKFNWTRKSNQTPKQIKRIKKWSTNR